LTGNRRVKSNLFFSSSSNFFIAYLLLAFFLLYSLNMNGEDDHLGPLLLRRITVTGGGGIRPSPSSHSSSSSSSASAIIRTPLEDDPINNDNLFWYDASALFANRSVCLGLTDILIA
jgi:hypothetical protein